MINLLPAILIGGPVHGDRSMLFYSLTKALRERDISHHALRIHPAHEKAGRSIDEQIPVRVFPINTTWNDELVEHLSQDLSHRLLPLLIDIGSDDEYLQACILQQCTHLILLFHKHNQASKTLWSQIGERYGLLPLAHISSSFENSDSTITAQGPTITGTFMSMEYNSLAQDPLFDCLVERVASLFSAYSHEELVQMHLQQAPGELSLHLSMLLHTIAPGAAGWEPYMLRALFEYIPSHISLSVYGKGPQWLYAALAAYTSADDFYQFSPCLFPGEISSGWVVSPPLLLNTTTSPEVQVDYTRGDESGRLTVKMTDTTLDYLQAASLPSLPFPPVPSHLGLILVGAMPTWLLTALVRLYTRAGVAWLACDQIQHCEAVVVFSQAAQHFVGEIIRTF